MAAFGRYCCKSILTVPARNIDFKIERDQETLIQKRTRTDSIVLNSNSTALLGDFITIGTSRTSRDVRLESAKWGKADIDQVAVFGLPENEGPRHGLPTGAAAVLHDARATTAVRASYSGVKRSRVETH
jgi:hypothetical protein